MIRKSFLFICSLWFNWWVLHLLYVAWKKQYVMARTNPFSDTVETPQTRAERPSKFWANVIVALILLPVAIGGLFLTGSELLTALRSQ
jgi:hypothetical protein